MPDLVGAVDQGTTSTRFMIFDHSGNEVGKYQLEHEQILPQAGWVEHNPVEIWERTVAVIQTALTAANLTGKDLAALGVTNQRETTVVWNRKTGRPYYNAIVWQDTRTDRIASALDRDGRGQVIRRKGGLPPATYLSGGEVTLGGGRGVPLTGDLGDQQAATVGQVCFALGEAKNTYGTGNFLLLNTGEEVVRSKNGLLTTVCYQFGENKPIYALEGSIAVTGSAVQWLRDQLGIISGASEVETLARQVNDNGGVYFVPAFSRLFSPYWRSDARGAIVGLSRFNTNAHLARATLEAICYQSRDVAEAMEQDSGVHLEVLKVDGGVTANDLAMQLQADVLGVPVSRPVVAETTALGAAYAAGLATGFWSTTEELRANWNESKRWSPTWTDKQRADGYAGWKKAVQRTLDWVEVD